MYTLSLSSVGSACVGRVGKDPLLQLPRLAFFRSRFFCAPVAGCCIDSDTSLLAAYPCTRSCGRTLQHRQLPRSLHRSSPVAWQGYRPHLGLHLSAAIAMQLPRLAKSPPGVAPSIPPRTQTLHRSWGSLPALSLCHAIGMDGRTCTCSLRGDLTWCPVKFEHATTAGPSVKSDVVAWC